MLDEQEKVLFNLDDYLTVGPGLTHHNSESGLAGKPCLLVKSKLWDHICATCR